MSSLATIALIAARDFRERLASRAFQLSTGVTILLVAGFILVPSFLDHPTTVTWNIGIVGEAPPKLADTIRAAAGGDIELIEHSYPDRAAAEAALADNDIDLIVDPSGEVVISTGTDTELTTAVVASLASARLAARAAELQIPVADAADLLTGGYTVSVLASPDDRSASNRTLAFFATIILFVSIVTYGSWILIGVIEEKTNRVVEVVLGTVRPHQLLAGKVIGIGLLGIAQVILLGGIAIAVLAFQSTLQIPPAAGSVFAWAFVWYILGLAFYSVAYAAAGSLVSRQEEAQNTAFPLTMMLMGAYFVASFSITGDNPILRAASLLPPFAPMTMPIRMAGGNAAVWEITLSLGLMLAATYGLIRIAGRVYAGGILQSGRRVKWREAWRTSKG